MPNRISETKLNHMRLIAKLRPAPRHSDDGDLPNPGDLVNPAEPPRSPPSGSRASDAREPQSDSNVPSPVPKRMKFISVIPHAAARTASTASQPSAGPAFSTGSLSMVQFLFSGLSRLVWGHG